MHVTSDPSNEDLWESKLRRSSRLTKVRCSLPLRGGPTNARTRFSSACVSYSLIASAAESRPGRQYRSRSLRGRVAWRASGGKPTKLSQPHMCPYFRIRSLSSLMREPV